MLGGGDDTASAFWAQPIHMMPQVAETSSSMPSVAFSRDQVIDAARRHIEEVERAAVRAIAASKNVENVNITEVLQASEDGGVDKGEGEMGEDKGTKDAEEGEDVVVEEEVDKCRETQTMCMEAPRYHTMLCGIKATDRNIPRDEMEQILRFAVDYFDLDISKTIHALNAKKDENDNPLNFDWLASVSDDDLWCFLMSHRIIGPLAKPDARIVRDAIERAQSVDQLERIHDAVVSAPIDPRALRNADELAWITSIQKSVTSGAAFDCT
jgi:hypothetical protein